MARRGKGRGGRGNGASLQDLTRNTHKGRKGRNFPSGADNALCARPGYYRSGRGLGKLETAAALSRVTPTPQGAEPHWPYGG